MPSWEENIFFHLQKAHSFILMQAGKSLLHFRPPYLASFISWKSALLYSPSKSGVAAGFASINQLNNPHLLLCKRERNGTKVIVKTRNSHPLHFQGESSNFSAISLSKQQIKKRLGLITPFDRQIIIANIARWFCERMRHYQLNSQFKTRIYISSCCVAHNYRSSPPIRVRSEPSLEFIYWFNQFI